MHLLIIEDDRPFARSVEAILKQEGCTVHHAETAGEGIDLAKVCKYDLILLDLSLPDMPGDRVVTRLRAAKIGTPVLVLSGDISVDARVRLLSAGADDFISKPFHKDELVARIRAVVRRSLALSAPTIVTGKLTLNLNDHTVSACGTRVHLTIKEYQMLEALALRKGATLSKDALLNQIYGGIDEPEMKIIDVFICKLRKKLAEATGGENYIHTVWGAGYRLQDPDCGELRSAA